MFDDFKNKKKKGYPEMAHQIITSRLYKIRVQLIAINLRIFKTNQVRARSGQFT